MWELQKALPCRAALCLELTVAATLNATIELVSRIFRKGGDEEGRRGLNPLDSNQGFPGVAGSGVFGVAISLAASA